MEPIESVNHFFSGVTFLGAAAVGLFFIRFWRKSRERLFLILAIAFWMFAAERVILLGLPFILDPGQPSPPHWVYLARFTAFMLLIVAIVEKNRPSRRP